MGTQLSTMLGLGKEYILIYTYELLRTKNSFELHYFSIPGDDSKKFLPKYINMINYITR